jgi:hypothetical protein
LGNGLQLYPVLAIGGTLFSLAAIASLIRQAKHELSVAIPMYAAAAFAVGGLLPP